MSWPICEFPGCTANHIDGTFCKRHQCIARPKETTMIKLDLMRSYNREPFEIVSTSMARPVYNLTAAERDAQEMAYKIDGEFLASLIHDNLPTGTVRAMMNALRERKLPELEPQHKH